MRELPGRSILIRCRRLKAGLLFGLISIASATQALPPKAQTPAQIQADIKAGFKGEYFLTRSEDPICPAFTKT